MRNIILTTESGADLSESLIKHYPIRVVPMHVIMDDIDYKDGHFPVTDIFDYYDQAEIGKPTGNDMAEGKLTLPVIYALKSTGDEEMMKLARKVKAHTVTADEIAQLVAFTKENGGIEYADKRMWDFHAEAMNFLDTYVEDKDIYNALKAYLDFVIERKA